MNTMEDLKREVQSRLRETIHGKEIDMMRGEPPRIPHMLGITPLHEPHEPANEEGTLLDPKHDFWKNYHEPVGEDMVVGKIEIAIRTLRDTGALQTSWPYGEEGDIIYSEVEPVVEEPHMLQTSCPNCDTGMTTEPTLSLTKSSAYIRVSVDCQSCEFSGSYKQRMVRE